MRFKTTKTEMGERPVYYHLCKLYVDGRYFGQSPVVQRVGEEMVLFARDLSAGMHEVDVVHGYVKDGEWDGKMEEQPRKFHVAIESGEMISLRYRYEVGWFEDKYVYDTVR